MTSITRRAALNAGLLSAAAACAGAPKMTPFTARPAAAGNDVFRHGVASGDPDASSVVIWTRVTPPDPASGQTEVRWEVATDETFSTVISAGVTLTGKSRDWTAKAVARALPPGSVCYYRFAAFGASSPVGRAKTLPSGPVNLARFAVVSCSNYPFGYFNVYDQIARRDDLDAILHLGDYLYEYDTGGYGGAIGEQLGRIHAPTNELVTLTDYRTRHAQYKADPSSQAMHASAPMIPMWDDHETSNNSWKDGAENHQPETEGDWDARRRAALQAYYEWMPVRDPAEGRPEEWLFRAYDYGDLLTLVSLETRLMARSRQFEYSEIVPTLKSAEDVANFRDNVLWDGAREMMGQPQLDYVANAFERAREAKRPWRLVANQVIMAKVIAPNLSEYVTEEDIAVLEKEWDQARAFIEFSKLGLPINLDAWDGYPAARERLYEIAKTTAAEGMIVVTGDTHTWWANDLADQDGTPMGVELGVSSVSSPSPYRPEFLGGKGAEYALLTNQENPSVRYLSGASHGYIDLEVRRDGVDARFMAVDTIESTNYNAYQQAAFSIRKKSGVAAFDAATGISFKEQWLF
ncbi:MAG: alkaline phosphatase [Alphaproteobacteria bacterium]|nr:alkaline phosphatase [Alphaproteobacteria bacterium]